MLFAYSVFLFPPVNGVPASLQWLRGGAVGASGASGGDEEEDGPWYTVFLPLCSGFSCASFTPLPLFLSQIYFPFPVLLFFYVHDFPFFFSFLFLCVFPPLPRFLAAPAPAPAPAPPSLSLPPPSSAVPLLDL